MSPAGPSHVLRPGTPAAAHRSANPSSTQLACDTTSHPTCTEDML